MATSKKPMKTRKPVKKAAASLAALYRKELPGEAAPDERQLTLMLRACVAISRLAPWDSLADRQVFAFDSESGQRWYVIVMGALGEVFGLQAYRGDAGFALFDDVQGDRVSDPAAFVARQDLFTVEFVRRAELSPLDKAILALLPDPIPPGTLVPQVTVSRPMRLRWYPNAADVTEINDGLMASLLFFEWLAKHPQADPWSKSDELPLVKGWLPDAQLYPAAPAPVTVEAIPHPAHPSAPPPSLPKLDEARFNLLLASVPKRELGHPIEVDVFPLLSPIASAGRPFFPWAALACDSSSGFLFTPVFGGLADKAEDVLLRCTLQALEKSPFRPVAYHVRDEFCRDVLASIATALEIPLKIMKLSAIAEARAAIESRLLH